MSPAANLARVKEGFFWQFIGQQVRAEAYSPEHRALIQDLRRAWPNSGGPPFAGTIPTVVDPTLVERVWSAFGGPVRGMIAQSELKLETARFDLDADGVAEPVYRMTALAFEPPRRPSDPAAIGVRIWSCDKAPGRDETHPYVIFVRHADAPVLASGGAAPVTDGTRRAIGRMNDVFWRSGRPYLVWILPGQSEFVVSEPRTLPATGGFQARAICQMGGRPGRPSGR